MIGGGKKMNDNLKRAEEEVYRRREEIRVENENSRNITRQDLINLDDGYETSKERAQKHEKETEKSLAEWRAEAEAERLHYANNHDNLPVQQHEASIEK